MTIRRWANSVWWLALGVVFFVLPALLDRGLVGSTPPLIAASDLEGKPLERLDSGGEPTLLYFWATWCPVCRTMQHSIRSVARDHSLVTVALQSGTDSELRNYLQQHALAIRVISDPAGVIAERYGLRGVPALFFIDRAGQIRFTSTGYTTEIGIRLRLWLLERLA